MSYIEKYETNEKFKTYAKINKAFSNEELEKIVKTISNSTSNGMLQALPSAPYAVVQSTASMPLPSVPSIFFGNGKLDQINRFIHVFEQRLALASIDVGEARNADSLLADLYNKEIRLDVRQSLEEAGMFVADMVENVDDYIHSLRQALNILRALQKHYSENSPKEDLETVSQKMGVGTYGGASGGVPGYGSGMAQAMISERVAQRILDANRTELNKKLESVIFTKIDKS